MAIHIKAGNQLDLVLGWNERLNKTTVVALSPQYLLKACQDIPLEDPETLLTALASQLGYTVAKTPTTSPKPQKFQKRPMGLKGGKLSFSSPNNHHS